MDLLAGYASDASGPGGSEGVPAETTSSVHTAPVLPSWASTRIPEQPAGLLDNLPAPSSEPKRKKRRTLPMTLQYVPDSDEEDQPKKKAKVSSKGRTLVDFLPAPKQDLATARLGTAGIKRAVSPDSSPDRLMEEGMPESTIQVPGPSYPAEFGNEAYRIAESMEAGAAADQNLGPYGHDTASDAYNSTSTMQQQAPPPQYAARPEPQQQQDLLEQALAEEMAKAQRRSGQDVGKASQVQFKQVNQEDLKYVHPAAREAAGGARTALGSDYELQLRSEAGPAPAKLAKRKHQISSLYHHAKIRELELLEQRGQGIKTKAETQAKYGW
ncbi:hypothetical protein WJX82_011459 [Trebouxia sp. C0006]